MWSAGSRPASPWCAAPRNAANPEARSGPRSIPTCSEPASRSSAAPTTATPIPSWPTSSTTHPRIGVAWQALQELYRLYAADDRDGALAALDRFTDLYATGQIPEFHQVVDTFLAWSDEILAFHEPAAGRISNGRLEGTNNKLQVLRRVAYGFVNRANYEARGILACGPIRSPQPRPAALTP